MCADGKRIMNRCRQRVGSDTVSAAAQTSLPTAVRPPVCSHLGRRASGRERASLSPPLSRALHGSAPRGHIHEAKR